MPDLPIRSEAVEAAIKVWGDREGFSWAGQRADIEAAIAAFCEAEGLKVHRQRPRCRGLWGFIFGHQFKDFSGQPYEFCARCGLRAEQEHDR